MLHGTQTFCDARMDGVCIWRASSLIVGRRTNTYGRPLTPSDFPFAPQSSNLSKLHATMLQLDMGNSLL
jgi:hypothetical protein